MGEAFFPVTRREAERTGIQYSSDANRNAPFPSQLRELRAEKGVSQEVLSKVLGVSKSTIGLWETGDTLPDAKAIHDLAQYFGVSADYILGLSKEKNQDMKIREICNCIGLSADAIELLQNLVEQKNSKDEVIFELINKVISVSRLYSRFVWSAALARNRLDKALAEVQSSSLLSKKYLEYWDKHELSAIPKIIDKGAEEYFSVEVTPLDAYVIIRNHAIESIKQVADEVSCDYCQKISDALTKAREENCDTAESQQ